MSDSKKDTLKNGIGKWDVSKVENFKNAFNGATNFNQDLSSWEVSHHKGEPEGFSLNTPNWVLPKPIWGEVEALYNITLKSITTIYPTPKKNLVQLTTNIRDRDFVVVEDLTKDDFVVVLEDEDIEVTVVDVIFNKSSMDYILSLDFSKSYTGSVKLEVREVLSKDSLELTFDKIHIREVDLDKSKIVYNTFDDFENGIATLTLKIYDLEGVLFQPDEIPLEDFKFVDDNENTPIVVVEQKEAVEGQFDIVIESDFSKELLITTVIDENILNNKYKIDTNLPSSISLSVGEYHNDGKESTFELNVTVLNIIGGNTTGLVKEDFELIQQGNNADAGVLVINSAEQQEDGTYLLILESDKDFKGRVGMIVKGVQTDLEFGLVDVDYTAIKPKVIDHFGSTIIGGEFTNPELNLFTVNVKLVDTNGAVFDEYKPELLSVDVIGDGEVIVKNVTENEDGTLNLECGYDRHRSLTVTVAYGDTNISGSLLLTHPLEVLDVALVDILGYSIVTVPEKGRVLSISVTARDINGKYVPGLGKDNFTELFNEVENILTVFKVEETKAEDVITYKVLSHSKTYLNGEVFVIVDGVRSTTPITIDYMPILQTPIDPEKSEILSGEYLDETITTAKLVVSCLDSEGEMIEDLIKSSFKLKNYETDAYLVISEVNKVGKTYELYFTDYGITDLDLAVYVNDVRIAKRYTLVYPRPRKAPVKTIATFDRYVVSEKDREINIIVEAFDDEGHLIGDLQEDELHALLVPEQDDVELTITSFSKLTTPPEMAGKYNFTVMGNKVFTGKIGFKGEEVTVVIPTETLNYNPVNIVDLDKTKILSGSYDPYNNSIIRLKVKVWDWDNNPIRRLKRSDFVVEEILERVDIFIISAIESEMPGEYNLTIAFDDIRKATFVVHVLGVPTANTLTLEHPVMLKTTVEVEMSFIDFVEAGGKRYLETLVVPRNHIGEIIEDLPKGIFVPYYPEETFDRAFDITRFTTVYDSDNVFQGYNVQLYRPTPFKGLLGVAVDAIRPLKPIEVDYDPIVIDPEKPEGEEEERLVAVVSKNVLKPKQFLKLYTCDTLRSNAIVDVSIFSDIADKERFNNKVNLYLSENEGLTKPDDRYLIMKDIPISNFEIGKIIVGSGQTLYIESLCKMDVNVRVSGLEETSDVIAKTGLLSSIIVGNVGINEVYRLDYPLAVYASVNINIVNNTNKDDEVTVWIIDNRDIVTVNEEHRLMDKIDRRVVKQKTMYTLKNITLGPNERIYINSNSLGLVASVTGIVINANF